MQIPFSRLIPSVAALALFAATIVVRPAAAETNLPPQAGQTAPDFTLPSQDATPVTLRDLRGKWVVLYFYPKDNTPGCTIEAHNFQRDLAKYEGANAVIVGVSVDSTDSHKDFCAKQSLTFKLLADTEKQVVEQYGSVRETPGGKMAQRNTFLIAPDGKIAKVWMSVNPANHSQDVLAALTELQAAK
jgi:peroxiredoxin Q/BCP